MIKKLSLILPICFLVAVFLSAQPAATSQNIELPERLGKIVFQSNPTARSQVYIIANSHRSERSGRNGRNTLQAQIETYRIGEWLINHGQVNLLLPEGFFGTRAGTNSEENKLIDCADLSARLADSTQFINAELLLHESFGVGLQQVEDKQLYRHIRDQLRHAQQFRRQSEAFTQELESLQRRRTAVILQNIPNAIDSAPAAMLTIGLAHLDDIVLFLEAKEVRIDAQQPFPALRSELELLKRNVNVTVIVPRSLAGLLAVNSPAKI